MSTRTEPERVAHTPGPWRSNVDRHDGWIWVFADPDAPVICDIMGRNGDECQDDLTDEDEANARLIAAAPDLLWAAERFLRHANLENPAGLGVVHCSVCNSNIGTCAESDCIVGTLRAAVRRATGEAT